MEICEKQFAENAIYSAVMESIEQVRNGTKPIPIDEVFARLEAKYVVPFLIDEDINDV